MCSDFSACELIKCHACNFNTNKTVLKDLYHDYCECRVKTLKMFFSKPYFSHFQHSNCCISGNNVNMDNIEVCFSSECALFEYTIKHTDICLEKCHFGVVGHI